MNFKDITAGILQFGKDTHTYWGCAIAGEVGELCNKLKKMERDGKAYPKTEIAEELADIFIYTELIARRFGIDLETAIIDKIEVVKKRRGEQK